MTGFRDSKPVARYLEFNFKRFRSSIVCPWARLCAGARLFPPGELLAWTPRVQPFVPWPVSSSGTLTLDVLRHRSTAKVVALTGLPFGGKRPASHGRFCVNLKKIHSGIGVIGRGIVALSRLVLRG